jgi:hypothetical protein
MGVFHRILLLTPQDKFEQAVRQAGQMAGFDPADASTVAAAKKVTCPVLVIRDGLGVVIPSAQCQAVFDAVDAPKKLVTVSFVGNMVDSWRDDWLANQMDSLAAMQGGNRPQEVAMQPPARSDGPAPSTAPAVAMPLPLPAEDGEPAVAVTMTAPKAVPAPTPTSAPAAAPPVVPATAITMRPEPGRFPQADRP